MRLIDADALLGRIPNPYERREVSRWVDDAPTVAAVPVVRGRWKRKIVDCGFNADWVCSQCGHRVMTDFVNYKYCPNCGADMRKDGEQQ